MKAITIIVTDDEWETMQTWRKFEDFPSIRVEEDVWSPDGFMLPTIVAVRDYEDGEE